jgi:hypothetical protein
MKGQVKGQGKVRQTTNKFFWWRILPSKVHRKTPLLHWHQKKFLSPAFPMNLTWMQSKKITIRILLFLSIYLKVTLCLRALSVCNVTFQEYDSEILNFVVRGSRYTKPKMEERVWQEDYWCGGKEIGVAAPPPYRNL